MPRFGWKKDRYDSRDYRFKARRALKIPNQASLEFFLPDVRNQGEVGSCSGFGTAGAASGLAKQLNAFREWFSPTWIYNGARYIEGSLNSDDGAYMRDCMDWVLERGLLLEQYWPYDPERLDTTSPPSKYNDFAAQYPILEYQRITGGADGVCEAIADGNFVILGVPWFNKWMDTDSEGFLPDVRARDSLAGGHAVFAYGYDKDEGVVDGQNSWDIDWGLDGRFRMPMDAFNLFNRFGGYDAYVLKAEGWSTADPEPEPEPEPEPASNNLKMRLQVMQPDESDWQTVYETKFC